METYGYGFESSVNSEGIETLFLLCYPFFRFESSVNSEGIETKKSNITPAQCLRAV